MEKITGDIYKKLKSSFEWKIRNFTSLPAEPGDYYESPPFDFYGATWCLQIYPRGLNASCDNVSLFLKKRSNIESRHSVRCKISIKKGHEVEYVPFEYENSYIKSKSLIWGRKEFINRSKLLNEIRSIAPNDILTILCTVTWDECIAEAPSETILGKNSAAVTEPTVLWKSLVRNMKDSFLKQKNCDVVIKVKDEEIPVHKVILESRSKVFEAMFEHDMSENRDCIVEINDCEPRIFRDFLLFLYCGEVENLSSENVFGLYALSEKYDVQDLKTECVKFMEFNLSLESVCDVLLVAETYGETQLNELANSFVHKNMKSVLSSDKWKIFENENQTLAYEILKSVMLTKASK